MKLFPQNLISLRLGHTLFIFVSIASIMVSGLYKVCGRYLVLFTKYF